MTPQVVLSNLRRQIAIYGSVTAMAPKLFLAYRIRFWLQFVLQILTMIVYVYFWRAVYAENATVSGLDLQQTLNYVLLAQIFAPVILTTAMFRLGELIRDGTVGMELLRPVDFQTSLLAQNLGSLMTELVSKLPILLLAVAIFGLHLPTDLLTWLCFAISILLGYTALFYFDWAFSCLAFYTTETWGLSVLRYGFATFFSGALVPLVMMPGWLQTIAYSMPFAQGLYVPVSLLSGTMPLSAAPGLWLTQIVWLGSMLIASRLIYNIAIRKITVQGG